VRDGQVNFYTCGPTVYNYFHIGNARVFVIFDIVRRYLEYRGYKVKFVQNFTDIDDKLIRRANELGVTVDEVAEKYIDAYFEDAKAIGIRAADFHPRATEFIREIINYIRGLEKKGFAYEVGGDVYFDVSKFSDYGVLSQQRLEDLEVGARVEVDERKRHPADFALWKAAKQGEPAWDSPWGQGRPGWHIECSVMSMHYLGETLDIHAGGPDLIFPHHENEIAQSQALTGKPFAIQWMHAGYLNINQEKMSKSLGNILTVRELRERYDPIVLRYFLISAHYRSPINFSPDLLEQAASSLERLQTAFLMVEEKLEHCQDSPMDKKDKELMQKAGETRTSFESAMDDDFNTADALAALFELARASNTYLRQPQANMSALEAVYSAFKDLAGEVLGLLPREQESLDQEVEALIKERKRARSNKDFARADAIRDELKQMGIILEDTPEGTRWKRARGIKP